MQRPLAGRVRREVRGVAFNSSGTSRLTVSCHAASCRAGKRSGIEPGPDGPGSAAPHLAARLDPAYLPPSGWAGPAAGPLVAGGVAVAEPFTDGPPVAL